MGSQSVTAIKSQKDRKEFLSHLLNDIEAFNYMLVNNLFESGIQRIGAEQELCIVDEDFRPSTNALKILEKINDEHYTTELALFNLEINLDPQKLENNCFSELEKELLLLLEKGQKIAEETENNKIILTGILPTLRKKDLVFKGKLEFVRRTDFIMTWGGLRGGISIALALGLANDMNRELFLVITYIVVVFSIIVQGLTVGKLVKKLAHKKE